MRSLNNSGLYATARINVLDTGILLDTRATVSFLSKVCYENIVGSENFKLAKVQGYVLSASRSALDF